MTEKTLSRREQEKLRHRERILKTALKLFNERGFHNVSMHDIADESEFAVGTIYTLFESKTQLFDEILDASCKKIEDELIPIFDDLSLTEKQKISQFIKKTSIIIEENQGFLKMYVGHYGSFATVNVKNDFSKSSKEIIDFKIRSVIEKGIAKGVFNQVSSEIAAMAIKSTLESLAFLSSVNFDKKQVREKVDEIEKFFMYALLKDI